MEKKVRLSQCMIVKNEEKNIRKALSWAKDIVFEQIVVDTGSTDKTVKIAEEMGAKVCHYVWDDDFSAAKNYALGQATGEWIVFADADEYLTSEHAGRLLELLNRLGQEDAVRLPHILQGKYVNLNDEGTPFAVSIQDRVFQNLPELRYRGRIHEQLALTSGEALRYMDCRDCFSILHTGYAPGAYQATGKAARNAELLRRELEEDAENYNALSYLGDALLAGGNGGEAVDCFRKVLEQTAPSRNLTMERFQSAGLQLMKLLSASSGDAVERELFSVAQKLGYPDSVNPDVHYFLGMSLLNKQDYKKAGEEFEAGLKKLEAYQDEGNVWMAADLETVYVALTSISQELWKPADIVKYGTLTLRINPYREDVLGAVLFLLKDEPGESAHAEGTWRLLERLYRFDRERDRLVVQKCAKLVGFEALDKRLASY